MKKFYKNENGMTLMTIVIMIVIIAIIAGISILNGISSINKAKQQVWEANLASVQAAVARESAREVTSGVLTPANIIHPGKENAVINGTPIGNGWYLLDEASLMEMGIEYANEAYVVNYNYNIVIALSQTDDILGKINAKIASIEGEEIIESGEVIIAADNQYVVNYRPDNASLVSGSMPSQLFIIGVSDNLKANKFTKPGYHFLSWNTEINGTGDTYYNMQKVKDLTTESNGSVTLYTMWANNRYKLAFFPNGGEGTMETQEFIYGVPTNISKNTFTKHGYSFNGWSLTADGTATYSDEELVSDMTTLEGVTINLYATWRANTYTITLNKNGGSGGPDSITATFDSPMPSAQMPTRVGYYFDGYFDSEVGGTQYYTETGTSTRYWDKVEDTILYAHWTACTYEVTLNKQNGTGGTDKVTATFDSDMPDAQMPTRVGYTFNGYFDAPSGGTKYYNVDGSSARTWDKPQDTSLYAHWDALKFNVTFDANSGTLGTDSVTAIYDNPMPTITIPTKTGYVFMGYFDSDVAGTKYYNGDGTSANIWDKLTDATLYAQWEAAKYLVTFDKQNGTGGSDNVTATYNSPMPRVSPPTRSGSTFSGYFTRPNNEGKQYYDSEGRSTNDWDIAEDTTLYASWVVARIESTYYLKLQEAINAASDGATVILLNNVTEKIIIDSSKNLTIDLSSKTLTGSIEEADTIINNGTSTIKNGTLVLSSSVGNAMYSDGNMILDNVTVIFSES